MLKISYLSSTFDGVLDYFKCIRNLYLNKNSVLKTITAQKMKFSIKDFSSKCDHIRSFLRICSHLLEKSLMENLIFV